MLELIFIFLIIFLTSWWFLVATRHPKGFPPGPRFSLPIIGNALHIGMDMPNGFERLRKKYGDVVGFHLGPDRAVVVSDYELIQELGARQDFADRQEFNSSADIIRAGLVKSGDKMTVSGIVFSNGQTWVEQRRFALHILRDLGFGKGNMEELIKDEVEQLCLNLERKEGEAMDVRHRFNVAVLNSLWKITTNEKLKYEEPKLRKILTVLDKALQEFASPINQIVLTYKPLLFIAKHTNIFNTKVAFGGIKDVVKETVGEHEDTYQEESMRDFIDHFLKETKKISASDSFKGADGRTNLVSTLIDLFAAGSETTSTTLNWGMLFMISNPDVQKKVQAELDRVTGRGRMPCWADRPETPYTEAVIHEIQRCGNIVPLSVFHATSTDCHLGGYFLPKNTVVFPNIGHVMRDPKKFPNPEMFDPTRYLTANGKFHPHPMVIPFGLGKRRCLGETLAKVSLYLFFTGILSHFTVTKENEHDYHSLEPLSGIVMSPQPYKLRFTARA